MQKSQPLKKRLFGLLLILISLSWLAAVGLDYLFHHPYYTQGISRFKYWGLLGVLTVLFGGLFLLTRKLQRIKRFENANFKGWQLYALLLAMMNLILLWYGMVNDIFESNPIVHGLYFSGFILLLHAAVLYITILGYAFGEILLRPFNTSLSGFSHKLIAIALGWSTIGFLMVVLGLFNALSPWILWPLFILLTVVQYRSIGHFLSALFSYSLPIQALQPQKFWIGSLLMVFIAVNGIGAVKAFPTGFDGLALYMNTANLISEYQGLPAGGQAFNWSVIMSLGKLLFGSTSVSILLSHLAGLFCLAAVYQIARTFVSAANALTASALFYVAPIMTFHNYIDEKVDLGFLFISLSSVLFLLEFFRNSYTSSEQSTPFKLGKVSFLLYILFGIYLGWLTGFAFGIKYTALFNGIALLACLFYLKGGRYAFFGSLFTAFSLVFFLGIYQFGNLDLERSSSLLIAGMLIIPGLLLLWWAFRDHPKRIMQPMALILAIAVAAGISFAPWGIKHYSENKSLSVLNLLEGKSPQPGIKVKAKYRKKNTSSTNDPFDPWTASKEKALGTEAAKTTKREELQRYQGFENGLPLFLSLPYDLTMNTNIPGQSYLDIGFLCLLLLPLIFISMQPKNRFKNLLWLLLIMGLGSISFYAVYIGKATPLLPETLVKVHPGGFQRSLGGIYQNGMEGLLSLVQRFESINEWLSSFSFASSLASLLLLLFAALYLAAEKLRMMPTLFKLFLGFIVAYLTVWFVIGGAIPWYAFPALALLPILIVYYLEKPEQFLGPTLSVFSAYFLGFSFGLYFLLNLCLHFTDPGRLNNSHLIFRKPFLQYATQNIGKEEVLARFNPFQVEALNYLNSEPSAKIYRVGTYMHYFIDKNDQRVLVDNQLGRFDEVIFRLSDPNYFIPVLRENGYRYILYDLNSAYIDETPELSLREKNIAFLNLFLDPNQVRLLVTDRIVEDQAGGMVQLPDGIIPGRPGLSGKINYAGSFALFELL